MYRRNHEEVSIKARRSSDEVHMEIGDKLEAKGEKAMRRKNSIFYTTFPHQC